MTNHNYLNKHFLCLYNKSLLLFVILLSILLFFMASSSFAQNYYCDNDDDGYMSDVPVSSCDSCFSGICPELLGTDCDDENASVNPGVAEVCDGIDNNCNRAIDEGVCEPCADGDDDDVCDDIDNCPYRYNPGQKDWDNDGIGDDCDDPVDDIDIDLNDYNLSIWDFSGSYIQFQDDMALIYTLIQDAKGKVTGSGRLSTDYFTDENYISIPVEIKGKVKGKNNVVTLKYKVKGKDAAGNKIQDNVMLELNKSILSLGGTEKMKICLNGEGCEATTAGFSLDVPDGMTGEAELEIYVLEGSGELTFSNGAEYPLYGKGKYNSKKAETKFQIKGVEASTKGIKIKLKIDEGSAAATFINGKALGQKLKYKLE